MELYCNGCLVLDCCEQRIVLPYLSIQSLSADEDSWTIAYASRVCFTRISPNVLSPDEIRYFFLLWGFIYHLSCFLPGSCHINPWHVGPRSRPLTRRTHAVTLRPFQRLLNHSSLIEEVLINFWQKQQHNYRQLFYALVSQRDEGVIIMLIIALGRYVS